MLISSVGLSRHTQPIPRVYFSAAPVGVASVPLPDIAARPSSSGEANYSKMDNFLIRLVSGIYVRVPRLPSGIRHFLSPERYNRLTDRQMEVVQIPTSDGIRLKGYWYPIEGQKSGKTIILGHGYTATAGCMLALVEPLHKMGWNVLAFDFRAHGASKGKKSSLGFHEAKDIAAAVRWAHQNRPQESGAMVYMGHSMGAAACLFSPKSLEAQQEDLQAIRTYLDGMVLDSSYEVIKPSEDPYVTQLYDFKRTNRLTNAFKRWVQHIVKGFESKSQQLMALPLPLNELYPARIYREDAELRKKPLLLLHGREDTRTPYGQGQAIFDTLKGQDRDDAPAMERVDFVSLNADHFVKNWKPTERSGKYKSILRDEQHYLDGLQAFLSKIESEKKRKNPQKGLESMASFR